MTSLRHHARNAAEAGLSVIPWAYSPDGSKRPTVRWKAMQTTPWTRAEASAWWRLRPTDNLGVVTGKISNLVVVDLDDADAVAWAAANLPDTPWRVTTGRGEQRGYSLPAGTSYRNAVKVGGMAIDIRGEGGYVSVPPSLHKSGRHYAWVHGVEAWTLPRPVAVPAWFTPLAAPPKAPAYPPIAPGARRIHDLSAYLLRVPPAVEGQGGQNHAVKTAYVVAHNALNAEEAIDLYMSWVAHADPPFEDEVALGHILSALRKAGREL